jgi:hypothetical protein
MGSGKQRPEVTDEEIGIRTFQMRKARAVERAVERIRQGLKDDWAKFTEPEIEALGFVLGELWAYITHTDWDELRFSALGVTDVRRILNYSRELVNRKRNAVDVLQDVDSVITAKS